MTVLIAWLAGYTFGTILFLSAIITFSIKIFLFPRLVRKLPEFIPTKKISNELLDEIETKLKTIQQQQEQEHEPKQNSRDSDSQKVESSVWLNGIINWFYLNLLDFHQIQQILDQLIAEAVVDVRRTPLGRLIINSEFKSISTGGSAPEISNLKILTGSSLQDPSSTSPLTLTFDLHSTGSLETSFTLNFICNVSIDVNVRIKAFKGSMCLVLQEQEFYLTFLNEPKQEQVDSEIYLSFTTRTPSKCSSYQIPMLNQILSRYLIRKGIALGCCFPNFMGKWYRAGPNQPPYPWNPSVIENPDLLYNWTPKSE